MLIVKTNKEIQLYKGDSGNCTLFINKGTKLTPKRYSLNGTIEISSVPSSLKAEISYDLWKMKIFHSGTYTFTYQNSYWNLNEENVELKDYGISIDFIPQENNSLTVDYSLIDKQNELDFYVNNINASPNSPRILSKKILLNENKIITNKIDGESYTEFRNCVDANGDAIIYFNPEDSQDIPQGDYVYQIKAKLWNDYLLDYEMLTLTNKIPIRIVDDNFSERMWCND